MLTSRLLISDVSVTPSLSSLPGSNALVSITNGISAWALVATLIGLLVGAAMWAIGSHSGNYQQTYNGRKTLLASGLSALLVGAAPSVVNFFFHIGQSVR
ncbi:MAG: DUF6112 family protein [Actinomycetota bacterium]|nr:DUF6112 family protein [Actinomycetota bacterium]